MVVSMPGVREQTSHYGTLRDEPPLDAAVARLAERQHGIIELAQLRELGLTASGVRNRVAAGRLHRIHRGVYTVGHRLISARGHWKAATLAYGPTALLSHRSAAALLGLRANHSGRIDVSLPSLSSRSRPIITAHRSPLLRSEDATTVDNIPCTTVARTLLDLAEVLDDRGVERAIEQAEILRLFDLRAVNDVLERANGRRGAGRLRRVLEQSSEPRFTESELEEAFLELCREHGLPRPEVAVWLSTSEGHLKADFVWWARRLVAETDGYAFHRHRQAFERDHRRDGLLHLAGWKVRRFTWRQIAVDAPLVAATVRAALAEPRRVDANGPARAGA
jgi:very-short-patch-repair endonuclease